MSAYGTIAGPARLTMPDGSPLLYNPGVPTAYDRTAAWATLTCPFCGGVEPNDMLLANNHWIKPVDHDGFDWCEQRGMCIRQNLVTNHISYYCKALKSRDPMATGGKSRKFDEARCRELLVEAVERGASIGIDGAKIMAFFTGTTTCGPCAKGEHGDCFEDTTWSTMLDGPTTCDCEDKAHG